VCWFGRVRDGRVFGLKIKRMVSQNEATRQVFFFFKKKKSMRSNWPFNVFIFSSFRLVNGFLGPCLGKVISAYLTLTFISVSDGLSMSEVEADWSYSGYRKEARISFCLDW
jgi:hypothetical protein